jgi:hypothetical protein
MRKALLLVALCPLLALAGGIALNTGVRYEFTDCPAGGSSAQTVLGGQYLFRVTDSDVFVCFAESGATCASGGEKFPQGTVMLLTVPGASKSVACRSSGSTGDVIFTRAQ